MCVLAYRLTLRIRIVGAENRVAAEARGGPVLHALWHQRMVLGILRHPRSHTVTMASRSRDGGVIAGFLNLWGFVSVRGSSSRGGGAAMRAMVDMLRGTTRWAALTPDGPRGPARRSKPGIAWLAREVGGSILPTGTSSTRPCFLRSWDRFLVPLPFSRCVVVFEPAFDPKPGESEDEFLARLDAELDRVADLADSLCRVQGAPRERLATQKSTGGVKREPTE